MAVTISDENQRVLYSNGPPQNGYLLETNFDRPFSNWKVATGLKDTNLDDLQRRIDAYLDQGYGSCYLKDPTIAALVEESLLDRDGLDYKLFAWVVMPNHTHSLLRRFEEDSRGRPRSDRRASVYLVKRLLFDDNKRRHQNLRDSPNVVCERQIYEETQLADLDRICPQPYGVI